MGTIQANVAFQGLTPDLVIDAVEQCGKLSDFRVTELNSYENRVFRVGIEDSRPIIIKFYRPERWLDVQCLEELELLAQLHEIDIPVAAPIAVNDTYLQQIKGYRFALFEQVVGRNAEPDNLDHLYQIGECIGQLHQACHRKVVCQRPDLTPTQRIDQAVQQVLASKLLPSAAQADYLSAIEQAKRVFAADMADYHSYPKFLIHGDAHVGNILITESTACLIDFDDCRLGIAVEDLWMLMGTQAPEVMSEILEGYGTYMDFNAKQLHLIPLLKLLRHIQYAGWLAQRWQDPAFPKAFTWFGTADYWQLHTKHIKDLCTKH
jgi:Ser/Thr protein kinase RdoA (MazF antagonist)